MRVLSFLFALLGQLAAEQGLEFPVHDEKDRIINLRYCFRLTPCGLSYQLIVRFIFAKNGLAQNVPNFNFRREAPLRAFSFATLSHF